MWWFYLSFRRGVDKYSTFKIKKSFTITFVSDRASQTMRGTAANHVKMKLNGSGSCNSTEGDFETYKHSCVPKKTRISYVKTNFSDFLLIIRNGS